MTINVIDNSLWVIKSKKVRFFFLPDTAELWLSVKAQGEFLHCEISCGMRVMEAIISNGNSNCSKPLVSLFHISTC